EEGRCIDVGRAFRDRGLRQLQLRERGAKKLSRRGTLEHFMERTACKAERGGPDRGTEKVEARHGDFEAFASCPDAVCKRNARAFEFERGERVRGHGFDALS